MDVVVALGEAEGVEDLGEDLREGTLVVPEGHSTLSHVMSVGCVAIGYVTVLARLLNRRVVAVAPLKAIRQDPRSEAQETVGEEVNGRFVLGD